MGTGSKIVRRRTEEAIRQKWKCYWCPTIMTQVPFHQGRPYQKGEKYPPTMVTLDHLFHKGDPQRESEPRNGERRYVAACRRCNEERGAMNEALQVRRRAALQKPPHPLPLEPAS